jgi:hypothetical protein
MGVAFSRNTSTVFFEKNILRAPRLDSAAAAGSILGILLHPLLKREVVFGKADLPVVHDGLPAIGGEPGEHPDSVRVERPQGGERPVSAAETALP